MVGREVDGPVWVVLGRSRGLCGRSWAALGAGVGGLGPLSGLCGRSWAAPGASVDGLGLLLGPLAAVLGRSRGLCGRSWAVSGPLWAVLGRSRGLCGRSWQGIRLKSGPFSSGKAIRTGDQAGKWPCFEREGLSGQGTVSQCFRARRAPVRIFSIDKLPHPSPCG